MELPSISVNVLSATGRRYSAIQQRIQNADPENATRVVASTRGLMADPVLEACDAGLNEFCEDYLPEGITKKPVITHKHPSTIWHFGGILQPNKLHLVVEFFEWIDMFDRATLLQPLKLACEKHPDQSTKLLIEVNPLGNVKKHGSALSDVPYLCDEIQKIKNIELMGLSCKSELNMSLEIAQKGYELTRSAHLSLLEKGILPASATELAIGSSRDLEKAVELGSTMVRVGSALFGKSAPSKSLLPFDEY